jgi:capsular exopolysaccharide synthesis family protein
VIQPTPHAPPAPDRPEQAFAFLWLGRWWILAAAVLGALLGAAFAQQRGTLWRATSVILVERSGPVVLGPESAMEQFLPRNYAGTQAALLRSTPVLKAALERPQARDNPVFDGTGNALAWLKRNLVVAVGNQDDLITLTLDSSLRAEACDVVNSVVDAYREFRAGSRRETATDVLDRLTAELDRYENERQAEQAALVEFMKANPGVRMQADVSVASERLRNLHAALTAAELEVKDSKATWEAAARLAETPELLRQVPIVEAGRTSLSPQPESGTSRQLEALRALRLTLMSEATAGMTARYRELQAQRQKLLAKVTREHPAVIEIERDLALLREQASADNPTAELGRSIDALEQQARAGEAEFAAAYVAALERRHASALARRQQLADEVEAQELAIQALEPRQAEYRMLETRLERASKIADLLYQRISEIDIVEEVGKSGATATDSLVYEYATPEGAVVASSKRAVVAIATFLGLVLGALIAWLRSLVDQKLRRAEDLAGLLPVLATAPRIEVSPDGILPTWASQGDFADAMRSLRMALSFGARGGTSKVFHVASAEADEGKTLVAAGLGIAMAQAGQRTLIIDADFHSPEQAGLFGVSDKLGLTQLLEHGRLDLTSLQTSQEKLYVLPSGPLPDTLDTLIGGPRLAATMKELAQRFDCIVIDSAPMLAGTEARVMAAVADETVLVIRSGKTTRKLVGISTASIVSVGGRIAGAVLNRVPRAGILRATSRYSFGSRPAKEADDLILVK